MSARARLNFALNKRLRTNRRGRRLGAPQNLIKLCGGGKVSPAGSVALLHTSVCRGLHWRPAPPPYRESNSLCAVGDSSLTLRMTSLHLPRRGGLPRPPEQFFTSVCSWAFHKSVGEDALIRPSKAEFCKNQRGMYQP